MGFIIGEYFVAATVTGTVDGIGNSKISLHLDLEVDGRVIQWLENQLKRILPMRYSTGSAACNRRAQG